MLARGFEVVYAEDYSVSEFSRKISTARIVIGPHGAGIANIAFMEPQDNSVVGEFFGAHISQEYWRMSCGSGFRYFMLEGEEHKPSVVGAPDSFLERNGRHYSLPVDRLETMLSQLD